MKMNIFKIKKKGGYVICDCFLNMVNKLCKLKQ